MSEGLHAWLYQLAAMGWAHSEAKCAAHGLHYCNAEDFVLDRGVDFVSGELDVFELATLHEVMDLCGQRFKKKECYYNAQSLVLATRGNRKDLRDVRYFEGIAKGKAVIPVHHGWATINNKVIDLTWTIPEARRRGRMRNRVVGVIPDDWHYRGVEFTYEQIRDHWLLHGISSSMILNDLEEYPALKMERINPKPKDERMKELLCASNE